MRLSRVFPPMGNGTRRGWEEPSGITGARMEDRERLHAVHGDAPAASIALRAPLFRTHKRHRRCSLATLDVKPAKRAKRNWHRRDQR